MRSIVVFSTALLLLLSCSTQNIGDSESSSSNAETNMEIPEGFSLMSIIKKEDPCGFVLSADDNIYLPQNLDAKFQKNDLKVYVKYNLSRRPQGPCKIGQPIDVVTIQTSVPKTRK